MKNKHLKDDTECPAPTGVLVLVGGAEEKNGDADKKESTQMEVLEAYVKTIKVQKPTIEVITSAGTADPEASFRAYEASFKSLGAAKVNHIRHDAREQVDINELKERINSADGVFFAGGDQLKLTSIYGGTELMYLIKQRYIHNNLVVGGTSAGAMAMSTPMIYAGVGRDEMIAGNVKITTGLEFLRDVCVDTHFVNRGRFVRMAQVIATNPSAIGLGIEENTALVVRNGTDAEVVGCGVVIVIDGKHSHGSNITNFNDEELVSIRGLQVDILSKGEKYTIPQMNPPHK
ncbi:MAG: hypothetical protein K0S09_2602 [Sphingobacteriaceae bacterium]|jgi:cyanophycinase|nr:hypothetical protein [Sphingobacteriaceae bacterium]